MKGKREYSEYEANQIRKLINQKVLASKNKQKGIRNRIRGYKFYFSDFSNKKGYTVNDFNKLIKTGKIIITDSNSSINKPEKIIPKGALENNNTKRTESNYENIERDLMTKENFKNISELDQKILDNTGFYCVKLKNKSKLRERYQNLLDKREFKFIYIGKAEGQSLRDRLAQELELKKPGTFFRSIGCVLNYLPIKGHLKGKSNQNNYKFSPKDKSEIIDWLKANVELSIVKYEGDFNIENKLIGKFCPLLNDNHNPLKLQELKDDKDKCRKIARE